MASTPEGRTKTLVKKYLKSLGTNCYWYMPVGVAYGVHGAPDFIGCYRGFFWAIETKAPGKLGNVTANQAMNLNAIADSGGRPWVVDGPETLSAFQAWVALVDRTYDSLTQNVN